jgi:hypothetical protein
MKISKNLVFIAAHNNQEINLPRGIESWKWYCNKHNIDIIVSNKTILADFKVEGYCAYEKWNEEKILNSTYEKIIIVDSDIIVRWNTPNIFDLFHDVEFGMVLDQGGKHVGEYHFNQWKSFTDFNINPLNYCNSGFIITTLNNYKLINNNIKKYFDFWVDQFIQHGKNPDAMDQTPINIIGWEIINNVTVLPFIWNNMVMTKYDDASFLNDSYIWHFTGPKLGGWDNKFKIMEQIWEHIKFNYE